MLLLALLFVFASIVLFVLGLMWRRPNPMANRLAGMHGELSHFDPNMAPPPPPAQASVLAPLVLSLGSALATVLPPRWVTGVDRSLLQAGQPCTTQGFIACSFICAATMCGFGLLIGTSMGGAAGMFILVVSSGLGFAMPKVWLSNRVRHRQKDILKSLPDAFDLITVCVEAGLGLEAALARVAEKVEGPFGEELNLMLREVALGKLRRDALRELAQRTGVPDLTSFINAVVQAENMGTSIAAVLRVQAEQMRTKRRQRAEQQAQAAPIKMMFPLVLCIFPTLFIVILGPAGISIFEELVAKEQ
jgi:tight adherence protein C